MKKSFYTYMSKPAVSLYFWVFFYLDVKNAWISLLIKLLLRTRHFFQQVMSMLPLSVHTMERKMLQPMGVTSWC